MEYINSIILGFVQGLTEFLPVSSSGHLMLLEKIGIGEESLLFNLMLHLATLLAVCFVYRKKLWVMIRHPFTKEVGFVLLATLPTVAIAFFIRMFFDDIVTKLLPFGFMLTTVFLILGSLKWKREREMNKTTALIIGVTQGIAAFGGVSRSGSTISMGIILGLDKKEAGDFSFILSIPIIIGSALVEVIGFSGVEGINWGTLLVGMLMALLSGILAIKLFLKILKKGKLWPFAIYTFALSIVSFIIIY